MAEKNVTDIKSGSTATEDKITQYIGTMSIAGLFTVQIPLSKPVTRYEITTAHPGFVAAVGSLNPTKIILKSSVKSPGVVKLIFNRGETLYASNDSVGIKYNLIEMVKM